MKYTPEEIARLAATVEEVKNLKRFVVERAVTHARITGAKNHNLTRTDCYREVAEADLFDNSKKNIRINIVEVYQANPYSQSQMKAYDVPRDFVFSPPGETELKWEQYLALKAELGQ